MTWLISVFYKALYVGGLLNELTTFAAFTALVVFLGGISGVTLGRWRVDRRAPTSRRAAPRRRRGSGRHRRVRRGPLGQAAAEGRAPGRRSSRRRWRPPNASTRRRRPTARKPRATTRQRRQRGRDQEDSLAAAAPRRPRRCRPTSIPNRPPSTIEKPKQTTTSGRGWPDSAGLADSPARRIPTITPVATGLRYEWCRNSSRAYTLEMCTSIKGALSSAQASRNATDVWVSPPALRITGSFASAARWIQSSSWASLSLCRTTTFNAELGGLTFDQRDQIVMGGVAVDLRLAAAQPAEVGSVDDIDVLIEFPPPRRPPPAAPGPALPTGPAWPARRAPRTAAPRSASSCRRPCTPAVAARRRRRSSTGSPSDVRMLRCRWRWRRRAARPAGPARRRTPSPPTPRRRAATDSAPAARSRGPKCGHS